MVTAPRKIEIELDSRGVAWVAGTRTKVREIVLDKTAWGLTPDQMHEQHPHLSLAQIHTALAYYYENQAAMDDEIQRDYEEAVKLQEELSDPEFRQRLQSLKISR